MTRNIKWGIMKGPDSWLKRKRFKCLIEIVTQKYSHLGNFFCDERRKNSRPIDSCYSKCTKFIYSFIWNIWYAPFKLYFFFVRSLRQGSSKRRRPRTWEARNLVLEGQQGISKSRTVTTWTSYMGLFWEASWTIVPIHNQLSKGIDWHIPSCIF